MARVLKHEHTHTVWKQTLTLIHFYTSPALTLHIPNTYAANLSHIVCRHDLLLCVNLKKKKKGKELHYTHLLYFYLKLH